MPLHHLMLASLLVLPQLPGLPASAQTVSADGQHAADEAAIQALGLRWQEAWNRRDAAGLAAIMDPALVFVSVLGPATPGYGRGGGRAGFQASHAALLNSPMFADSNWRTIEVRVVRWLRPDIAVAHVLWETTGDRVRHIRAGTPRRGNFTWVLEKQAGEWRVVASQNTEVMPPLPGQ